MRRYRWQRRMAMALAALMGVLLSGLISPAPASVEGGMAQIRLGHTANRLNKQALPKRSPSAWAMLSLDGFQLKQQSGDESSLLAVDGVLESSDPILTDNSLYDLYPFEGTAEQAITIRMESEAFDTYLMLIDAEGRIIGENDDASGSDTNATLTMVLPETGTYQVVANAYDRTGQGPYRLTVTLANESDLQQSEADRLYQQGTAYYEQNQYPQALQTWAEALALYQAIGNTHQQGATADRLGAAHRDMGNYREAIPFFEQALEIARELQFRQGESVSLGSLGSVYRILGDYPRAIELQQQSLTVARSIGDRDEESSALTGLGLVYEALNDYPQAVDFHQAALAIDREIGDREGEADSLSNLGNIYYRLDQYERAIDLHQQALAINQAIGDRRGEGHALGSIGLVYIAQGDYRQALNMHQQHLAIAREISDRRGEANALGHLGLSYFSLGNYAKAMDHIQQQLAISRDIGFRQGEASALGNLGSLHYVLGDYPQAIKFLQQYLEISQAIGDRLGESNALGNLSNVYLSQNKPQQALEGYQRSITIAREIGDRAGEADSLANLGTVYALLDDYPQAIEFYQQGLAIARDIGDRQHEAAALDTLGNVYDSLEEYDRAIESYKQALAITRGIGDRRVEANVLNNLGLTLFTVDQLAEAEATLRAAIDIYETMREGLSDAQRISILETQATTYQLLQEVLDAQSKSVEALIISEQGRAQAFALQLSQRFAAQESTLFEATQAPDLAKIQQVARDQNTTLVEYSLIGRRALYIWVVQPTGDIQFRAVEFEEEEDALADIRTNPIATLDAPVYQGETSASALDSLVVDARSRGLGVVASADSDADQLFEALYTVLIDPIADLLPTDPEAKVAFIPQDTLFLVPFAALQSADGTYLLEKHTVLTAPSIQVLGLAVREARGERLALGAGGSSEFLQASNALVVGNPEMPEVWLPSSSGLEKVQLSPLPGTEAEALAIGDFLNVSPLIGNQATEATVKQQLPTAPLIHLATHGLLEYGDPQSSGVLDLPGAVALTPGSGEDGLLTAAEILDMDLQAELAILSACDTGLGRITGDGVVGLSRSLMAAGVPSVIVSLWAVPDAPTAELMTEFYRQLQQGQTKVQALRQAMLSTMQQYPDPVNWAAFTLTGAAE
ncbi:MAG: tetratricopeptide repeat protein [Cyanobacteria bacterium P01_A01_bin.123]